MIENIFFFTYYALVLLFGIVLSFAFSGLRFTKKNNIFISLIFLVLGIVQLGVFWLLGETKTWELYPLIVHLPIAVFLCLTLKKKVTTVLAAISLTYLCCQPSKWIGLLAETFINSNPIVTNIRIIVLLLVAFIVIRYLALYISEIFNKDNRSVLIFSSIPMIYYLFDYTVGIYTDLWNSHYRVISEFLPFLLCVAFVAFCVIYYKEYEKKPIPSAKNKSLKLPFSNRQKKLPLLKRVIWKPGYSVTI